MIMLIDNYNKVDIGLNDENIKIELGKNRSFYYKNDELFYSGLYSRYATTSNIFSKFQHNKFNNIDFKIKQVVSYNDSTFILSNDDKIYAAGKNR